MLGPSFARRCASSARASVVATRRVAGAARSAPAVALQRQRAVYRGVGLLGSGCAALYVGSTLTGTPVVECDAAAAPAMVLPTMEELERSRAKTWSAAWADIVAHWLSFGTLTLATFVSIVVDRIMLSGQVQQLMQLPGQLPLEALLSQMGVVFSIKAIQLVAEVIRSILATRLGEKVELKARAAVLKTVREARAAKTDLALALGPDDLRALSRDAAAAKRAVVAEAAPKVIVEVIYASVSAIGALTSSAPLAVYFVAHEAVLGQAVGLASMLLAGRRDGYAAQAETARDEWERAAWQQVIDDDAKRVFPGDNAASSSSRLLEAKSVVMKDACVSFGDAQTVVEQTMGTSQLFVLSSYVASAAALVDRNVLGADGQKYQKVMGCASNAMQAAAEASQTVEKFGRATDVLCPLYRLEASIGK